MKTAFVIVLSPLILSALLNISLIVDASAQQKNQEVRPPEKSEKSTPKLQQWKINPDEWRMQGRPEIRPPEVPRKSPPPQLPERKEGEVLENGKCKKRN